MKRYLLSAIAVIGVTNAARADDSLTAYGLTLYGTIDIGVAYQTHGAPISDYYSPGLAYNSWGTKNFRGSMFSIAPDALSASKIGLRGTEALVDDWSVIFKLETAFSPASGDLIDSPKSSILNDGIPLNQQKAGADSSRAGQAINGPAFIGVGNRTWGTLSFGRHDTPMLQNVIKYDPMGGSNAFSLLGVTGTFAGAGVTQEGRFDNSVSYDNKIGPVRFGVQNKFGEGHGGGDETAYELTIGTDFKAFSIDGVYARLRDAIAIAYIPSLTKLPAAPVLSLPLNRLPGTLAGTISDNETYAFMASYVFGAPKLYAGYEHIDYGNPSHPLPAGAPDIGGYILGTVNDNAFTKHKVLNVAWTGLKYSFTPAFNLTGAYYYVRQNAYAATGAAVGCSTTIATTCSGQYNSVSIMGDYHLSPRFTVYGGVAWSQSVAGLASGALNGASNTIDPTVGIRFSF